MDNLFRDLQQAWARDGRNSEAVAALARWSRTRPAATAYANPADLVDAGHSRHDGAAAELLEQLTEEAPSDPWAARTILQALLPGLAALTRRHRDLVGEGREPFTTVAELDQFVVCTAFERIAVVAAEAPTFRLRRILDSTWSRLRTHAAGHRREWRSRRPLSDATGHAAPPPRTDAEELAVVLVDAVQRRVLRPGDAGLVYATRVVGQAPAEVAAALECRTPSLVRRRHRVEQVLAAEVLGQPRPPGLLRGVGVRLMGPGDASNSNWITGLLLLVLVTLLAVVWAGAELASLIGGQHLAAGAGATFHALLRLPANASDPRLAWGPPWQSSMPGPVLYWACTAVAAALAGALIALGLRVFGRGLIGTGERRRLGVETKARLATAKDVRPLIVKGPTPGRLILGRVQGRLVATERRDPHRRGRRDPRAGDRSAVAVFGPSRCGKSANLISAILENEGPAILSSVRGDLLEATIERRRQLGGEIKVFDPTGVVPDIERSQWSPVAKCGTVTGAKKLAHALASANPNSLPHDGYFATMAEELLWPLLFTAVVSGATMGDVVRWVLADEAAIPDITDRLDPLLAGADPVRHRYATIAMRLLTSLWDKEPRTRAGFYTTALTMIANWEDPVVADCATTSDITLDWLVRGPNTLYICSPPHEQLRLATVFGGILDDLLQQAYEWQNAHRSRLPDTLMVLDEAGNTPARWLPQVASTCSGIGIQLVTVWQSKAQVDDAYGTLADSVLTNHGTKLFFSGISDPSTLDYVSRLLGDEEVVQRGASSDVTFGRRSVNESATRLRLVPADILRQVPPGEGLLIHGTLRPAHLKGRFYYAEKPLRRLAGEACVEAAAAALAPPPPPSPGAAAPAPAPSQPAGGLPVTIVGGTQGVAT